MSYNILSNATHGNVLPLLIEMNKLSPNFIQEALITPIKNYIPAEKKENNSDINPESLLISLFSNANLSDIDSINFIYDKVKEAGVNLSNNFFIKLIDRNRMEKYNYIMSDDLERTQEVIEHINKKNIYNAKNYSYTLFCIDKGDFKLAHTFFLKNSENLDNLIKLAKIEHLTGLSILQHTLDPSKSIEEYKINTYEKILSNIFKDSFYENNYERSYSNPKLHIFNNFSNYYEKFMIDNMPNMSEDLIYKSLVAGFKDDSIYDNPLTKVLKKLKINKNSLEYANLAVDSLDSKVNLKKYKTEFYKFPDSFWTESNLLKSIDNGLSRGMKILLDYDLFINTWDSQSIEKVRKIYADKIEHHIPALYRDYLDRNCFNLLEVKSRIFHTLKGTRNAKYILEGSDILPNFIQDYINVKDKNNIQDDEFIRIDNVINFYLNKNTTNEIMWSNSRIANTLYPVLVLHSNPIALFEKLESYKDIVLDKIKNNNSTIDNNVVLAAVVHDLVSFNDLKDVDFTFTVDSLNIYTENDLKNSSLKKWVQDNSDKVNPMSILKTITSEGVLKYNMLEKADMITNHLIMENSIPKTVVQTKVNKF